MTSQPIQPNLRLAQAYGVAAPRSGVPARAASVRDSVEISGAVSQDQLPTLAQRAKTPKTAALVATRMRRMLTTTPSQTWRRWTVQK